MGNNKRFKRKCFFYVSEGKAYIDNIMMFKNVVKFIKIKVFMENLLL